MNVVTDRVEWRTVLEEMRAHDFYHTYDYHALAAEKDADHPMLLVHEEKEIGIALPILVRSGTINGFEFKDATSVYGYSGPIVTGTHNNWDNTDFRISLTETLGRLGIVSVFSRLHPLIGNESLVEGLGIVEHCGNTVSIDLTQSDEAQWEHYSSNHRRGIRKCRKLGVECFKSGSTEDLEHFARIYSESMKRVSASREYFFETSYFEKLLSADDFAMHLFVCRCEDQVICGGLFSSCNGIVQYHLGGTSTEYLMLAPSKLMFDSVRCWAMQSGHTTFHLGGGLGGNDDSLYRFKRGFSKIENPFYLWKWILDNGAYESLTDVLVAGNAACKNAISYDGFFPAYRSASRVPTHSN